MVACGEGKLVSRKAACKPVTVGSGVKTEFASRESLCSSTMCNSDTCDNVSCDRLVLYYTSGARAASDSSARHLRRGRGIRSATDMKREGQTDDCIIRRVQRAQCPFTV